MTPPIDSSFNRTFKWLRDNGFDPTSSGYGEVDDGNGPEPAFDYPYIGITVGVNLVTEAVRLKNLLLEHRVIVNPISADGNFAAIEASYDPMEGTPALFLYSVNDYVLFQEAE